MCIRDSLHRIVGQPVLELSKGLLARKNLEPLYRPLSAIGLLDCGVENTLRSAPDVAARAVALDKRNDRVIGNAVLPVRILDRLAVFGQS